MGKLSCCEMTLLQLSQAVDKVHEKVSYGYWSLVEGSAFIHVSGINEKSRKEILYHAENAYNYNVMWYNKENNPDGYDEIHSDSVKNPNLYAKWKKPACWMHPYKIDQYVETYMHLLTLLVTKSTVSLIESWASSCNLYSSLRNMLVYHLEYASNLQFGNV
jgi:hypothetical protein